MNVVCGIVGQSAQRVLDSGVCAAGEIEMNGERPGPEHIAGGNGDWVLDLTSLAGTAKRAVDVAAGEARQAWCSDGWGVVLEYEQAETEAQQYLDAVAANGNDPTGITVPPSVQSAADYINGTAVDGANDILAQSAAMRTALNDIRAERLAGKTAVDAAVDDAGIQAARDAAITNIAALHP